MPSKDLFPELLQAFHGYQDALETAEDDEDQEEDVVAAVDKSQARLKAAFDAYVLDLIKRKA